MGEPKAFASLSSGLLARKGAARPAMRPQGFGGKTGAGLEDLGWDDMGFEPPKPANLPERDAEHDAFGEEVPEQPVRHPLAGLTPIGSPVHDQHAQLADRLAAASDEGEEDESDETAELVDRIAAASDEDEEDERDETAELFEGDVPEMPTVEVQSAEVVAMPARAPVLTAPVVAPQGRAVAPRRAPMPRAAAGSKDKAAFTLRLDKARHLKLRLACAMTGQSAQHLVTEALDACLAAMPELDSMAERAPRPTRRAS